MEGSDIVGKNSKSHVLNIAITDIFNESNHALIIVDFFIEKNIIYAEIAIKSESTVFVESIINCFISTD